MTFRYHPLLAALGQWLSPPHCVLCELPSDGGRDLCGWCAPLLPRPVAPCPRCAQPRPAADAPCGHCVQAPPNWQRAVAACRYAGDVPRLVHRLKHGRQLVHAGVFAGLLADAVQASGIDRPAALVPVPLHAARRRQRTFDQAEEIACRVGRALAIPVRVGAVERIRATPPQQSLDRTARLANLRGAFAVRDPRLPDHVALVDDVLTTGATASRMVRVLATAGVRRVDVWVFARA